MNLVALAERGVLPDRLIRMGIRQRCRQRLREERAGDLEQQQATFMRRIDELRESPIAIHTDAANEQHYEVPADFFRYCLGRHRKYSSCYWPSGVTTLDEAEAAMLQLTCERAQLADGQAVLELGCGWGSLTLWMAEHFPASTITAVSNSHSQRAYIEAQARGRGLANVRVLTRDVNELALDERFDRVVSVEMFEHMRNYRRLLDRIRGWMKPGAKLFVHLFCHRHFLYPYVNDGDDANWMANHFFTGGLMPSADTLHHFQEAVRLEHQWHVSGRHYERTANAWLMLTDRHRDAILPILAATYGEAHAELWLQRWRIFFMACAELFGLDRGREWLVAHYRFVMP